VSNRDIDNAPPTLNGVHDLHKSDIAESLEIDDLHHMYSSSSIIEEEDSFKLKL
jgi:hypothetical protein